MTGRPKRRGLAALWLVIGLGPAMPVGAAAAEIRIAVLGDSNVTGYGLAASQAYPARLERALRAKGFDVKVRNAGLNGDTTTHLLSRLPAAAPDGTRIAVVWIGTNDLRQGLSSTLVRHNIDAAAAQLKARGIATIRIDRSAVAPLFAERRYVLPNRHLNAAGYDRVVAATLPRIEQAVREAAGAGNAKD